MGLEKTKNYKIRLVEKEDHCTPEFSNLTEFVRYFTKEAITFESGNQIVNIVLKPILPNTRKF